MKTFAKWIGGTITGFILAVLAPIVTALVKPEGKVADAVRAAYPPIVVNLIAPEDKPLLAKELDPAETRATTLGNSTSDTVSKSISGTQMVITPAMAPLTASIAAPIISSERSLAITIFLKAKLDALKVFVPYQSGLDDWSARVVESGANCTSGNGELHGVKSFYGDLWRRPDVMFDELPQDTVSTIDETVFCDKPVFAGQTFLLIARVDRVDNGERNAIRLTSPPLRIVQRR